MSKRQSRSSYWLKPQFHIVKEAAKAAQPDKVLWYREANNSLVFGPPEEVERIHQIRTALCAETWGEFRRLMPADEYMELIEAFFENAEGPSRVPSEGDAFSAEWVPGYCDGDYPTWLQAELGRILPQEILDRFANCVESVFNGPFWQVNPGCESQIISALRAARFTLLKREDLDFL